MEKSKKKNQNKIFALNFFWGEAIFNCSIFRKIIRKIESYEQMKKSFEQSVIVYW